MGENVGRRVEIGVETCGGGSKSPARPTLAAVPWWRYKSARLEQTLEGPEPTAFDMQLEPEVVAHLNRFPPTVVPQNAAPALQLDLLGRLAVAREGHALVLPSSRKVRALLAYLVMAPGASGRSPLSELLWDVPNDPRGELRWCLSKIRGLFNGARQRVLAEGDSVRLDLSDCFVDAIEVARATEAGVKTMPAERLRGLLALFKGDFLEGLEIDRSPSFNGWLTAQRRRFRNCHTALLEHLVKCVAEDEVMPYLEQWLALAPFDGQVHQTFLNALERRGLIREGEEHLAATVRLFDDEGLDSSAIRHAWRAAHNLSAPGVASRELAEPVARSRASVAVMPFVDRSSAVLVRGGIADALAHDVITRLAKLRSLFVIAQGTVFALHDRNVGAEEAGRMLNVDFAVSGAVRVQGGRLSVNVELTETRSAHIVWAESFQYAHDDAFVALDEIGNRIVASVANEIETLERNQAILKPPNSLDAWEAHHRGLWHMYQYRKADNDKARHFFQTALCLDPTFSRAYAGLSFTHFQDVFQNWGARKAGTTLAYEAASKGLMADERDPAVHWAMGRALWLNGNHEDSLRELTHSIELSPNFALGHYNLAFVHSIAGDPQAAIGYSDRSRNLSPFDPMLFGMLATRAMALARLGHYEEAADWAVKAALRPNAFPHIHVIAACCLVLAGARDKAKTYADSARKIAPQYRLQDFFSAFPFEAEGRERFRAAAHEAGIS